MFNKLFSIKEEEKGLRTYKVFNFLGIKIKKRIENRFDILDKEKFERELTLEEQKYYLGCIFKNKLGYECDFENPKSFNEKMQWLKIYYRNPLMTTCADKVAVRDYIKEKLGEEYLIPTLGVYDTPDEIDFDSLPEQFVIKVNWGSGQNIIVKDKSKLDIDEAKKKLTEWMKPENNWYLLGFEWGYKNIEPKIIIEKYIEQMDGNLLDWKFFCFNGVPKFVQVDVDRYTNHTRCFYDMDYDKQNFAVCYPFYKGDVSKPDYFEKMKEFATILSGKFFFARVDFYDLNGEIKFGEITFYPESGIGSFDPIEWDYKLGEMLDLSGAKNVKD